MEEQTDRGLSALACYACKRRKVKCDRALPVCCLCTKSGGGCEYPTHCEKPGPKTGSTQKSKRRRLNARYSNADESPVQQNHHGGVTRDIPSSRGVGTKSEVALRSNATPQDTRRLSRQPDEAASTPFENAVAQERHPSAPAFSQIMYPSHEAQTRPQSPSNRESASKSRAAVVEVTVKTVCEGLGISKDLYTALMESYFANMTSFTLVKPYGIEAKFPYMRASVEAEALVAAMFSFSARFHAGNTPTPSSFAQIARTQLEEALDQCGDSVPPLWLLQTSVLVAFHELTRSVRSKSWRSLGNCIRLAYDMNLHLIDANFDNRDISLERWSVLEERRRAWWAIWEMDVFASTIRRLPMAIDWTQNLTFLPVRDRCWFDNVRQESCFLVHDPSLRWKRLSQSGNTSPRAWFIVINSLMRNAQLIVYNPGSGCETTTESNQAGLTILSNCLYCATTSLPTELAYQGETLDFRTKGSPQDISCRQYHSDIYSLHLMSQLVRFMIYHHKICAQAPWLNKPQPENGTTNANDSNHVDRSSWSNYMKAAEDIVTIVRNSSPEHYKYVNPFLSNTLWFAAAAQIACRVFGPPSFNKVLIDSNYELLALAIDRFLGFWNCTDTLKRRLSRIEARLEDLMAGESSEGNESRGNNGESTTRPRLANMGGMTVAQQDMSSVPGLQEAEASGMDSNALPFMPMLYDGLEPSSFGDQQLFLDDPQPWFPYGVDELWMSSRMPQL